MTALAYLVDDVESLVKFRRSVGGIAANATDKRPAFPGSGGVLATLLAFLVAGATVAGPGW